MKGTKIQIAIREVLGLQPTSHEQNIEIETTGVLLHPLERLFFLPKDEVGVAQKRTSKSSMQRAASGLVQTEAIFRV